jgi:hypothetical protein
MVVTLQCVTLLAFDRLWSIGTPAVGADSVWRWPWCRDSTRIEQLARRLAAVVQAALSGLVGVARWDGMMPGGGPGAIAVTGAVRAWAACNCHVRRIASSE